MPGMTMEERLKSIGLPSDRNLEDLKVEDGETLDLDPANERFSPHLERLQLTSIRDVKRIMGIPDEAVEETEFSVRPQLTAIALGDRVPLARRIPPLVLAEPVVDDVSAAGRFYDISARYVFGDSRKIDPRQIEAVDKWFEKIRIHIPVFTFRDIYVGRGATLNVKTTGLLANDIVVEKTGRIKFRPGSHSNVYAASFKGL